MMNPLRWLRDFCSNFAEGYHGTRDTIGSIPDLRVKIEMLNDARIVAEKRVGRQRAECGRLEKANLRYSAALTRIAAMANPENDDECKMQQVAREALYGKVPRRR